MTPPVHVLQILGNAIVGGMESWVERLVERLPPEQFRFTVLAPFESRVTTRLHERGVPVWIAPIPPDPPWATIQTATGLVQREDVDLIHAHMAPAHLLGGLASLLTGKPALATIHSRDVTTLDLEIHRAARTHLSVVCRQTLFQAMGLGVDPARLSCEPNGVDTAVFQPRPRPGALRPALGLAADTPLVGFVGRLSPEKGPEVLVRAALHVGLARPDVHIAFVGVGPMAAELRTQAQRLGVAERVHFAGARDDMPATYPEFDLLVSCSHSEAMPLALLEGMACGLPAVATRVGGVPDIVEHGETGLLIGPSDFDALSQAIVQILGDDALRARMGARARERALRQLDIGASVERVGALMARLARPASALREAAAGPRVRTLARGAAD
jgi:glycosyltransferase involved in cell wall biosynthesis